ncbi:retrotransposon protein, putative, ty1-copia subclass [Tanacetum coccineum]|uniref:Retrotransposon protein, putative, ty1-copia subclass n=1 Tax=Tanacetum coccineum TaxID=301880 RepID=A0ABQ5I3S2_9ASTR
MTPATTVRRWIIRMRGIVNEKLLSLKKKKLVGFQSSVVASEIPMEVKGFEPPQEEVILIRMSERTHRAPNYLCLNVEAEEHSLGDLNEPTSYKVSMLDSESNKRIDSMNAEIQSMIDNMVWVLVNLPPNSIRILISIAAFYDYEIWQMDVKTAFLNGYLDEDIYMVQPEGFVDPNHPRKVWGCEALVKRDTPDKLQQRSVKCIFIGYPKETMGYYFYFPPENKIVVARYAEFFKKNLITQEVSRRDIDLEEIQDEDTSPSEITSEIPMEVEGFEPPQEEEIPIRRSERSRQVPNRLCLNVEINVMNAEIQSMMDNMVWVLVDLPPGCKTVGSKWIFKKKTDMDAIRILISIAAYYDYEIWKIDVKTAFVNSYLDEDIYMVQLEGFVDPNHPRKVCKLQRSIYGLKQASRSWNKRFDEEIKRFGFDQNLDEPCVYQKASGSNVTFLILSKRLIGLSQNAYMDKILKRYKMDNSKCGHILMQERLDLHKTQGDSTPKEVKRMQNVPYASTVGSIMYAMTCTRPDVAFANTKDMYLVYGRNLEAELRVDCYCNAGFETDRDDTKHQTRYVFILNGGTVD